MATTAEDRRAERFKMASAFLDGLERQQVVFPGAKARVLAEVKDLGGPAAILRQAVEHVFGTRHPKTHEVEPGRGGIYLDPSHKADPVPLRAVLKALAAGNFIKADAVDKLFRDGAAQMAAFDFGTVAEHVGGQLQSREANPSLVTKVPPPFEVQKVRAVIEDFESVIPGSTYDRDELAEKLAYLGQQYSGAMLHRTVAEALSARKQLVDGFKFNYNDPIFREGARSQPQPTETASGESAPAPRQLAPL